MQPLNWIKLDTFGLTQKGVIEKEHFKLQNADVEFE